MKQMKCIILQAVAVVAAVLVFSACNKSDNETDKVPVITTGNVQIDDNDIEVRQLK